jgi:hypothetical protein
MELDRKSSILIFDNDIDILNFLSDSFSHYEFNVDRHLVDFTITRVDLTQSY